MKTIELKTYSCPGKDKPNEDYILCRRPADDSLIAVLADGMGGLSYGAEAARNVAESIFRVILENIQKCSPEDVLRKAFDAADSAIRQKCRDLRCKMGAAVTVAWIIDNSLYYAWQGNVRLYKVSNEKPVLLTTDHIVAETEGTFLTRCVNGRGYREAVEVKHEKLEQIDSIYICSDGCYQHMDLTQKIRHNIIPPAENIADDSSLIEIKFV